jgi:hypothetical protein
MGQVIKHFDTIYIWTLGILDQMNREKMEIFIGSGISLFKCMNALVLLLTACCSLKTEYDF